MFVMPSATIEITEVHVVKVSQAAASCTIHGETESSWTVLAHADAFWFVSARDVESRIIPQLDTIAAVSDRKLRCVEVAARKGGMETMRKKMAACCKLYNASQPNSTACYIKGRKEEGNEIASLAALCTEKHANTSSAEYTV